MKWLIKLVLAVTPRLLWWAMVVILLAAVNLAASEEIWPNTPAAEPACELLLAVGFIGLLTAGPWTLWRLAGKLPWLVLRVAGCVAAVLAGLVAVPLALIALWVVIEAGGKMIGAG